MAPVSTVVAAPAYQPGKAPYLLDDSPAGLASFSRAARLFFHAKSVKDDALKVAYVGGGLVGFPELYNWKGDDLLLNTGSTTARLQGPERVATA
ncbi:hypothetical protein JCM10296v2_006188 [Rhodotorula toruloides]